ncbi:hypothetical protein [Flavobacterium reichenbachii]|uniref:Lipoprotein n=1 Tax=Flavobacterium reichenbachii TaxID=362418 RepID=A0A085ZKW7_9FLAO|nr:hypothetical protein [Flavobacterium reichenbachii]KFF05081.1 hypothetical protein IW19_05860 [Flavobacterium reichenbachii]OXB16247.1 hypothetical protein B0A68_08295 [Flavobacterium reichenbachii]
MRKIYFVLLFASGMLFTSCDPAQNLNFTNNGKSSVKVKLTIDPKTKYERLSKIQQGDSIVFNLKPLETEENEDGIYFGIGVWNDQQIKDVAESIKRIEIENNDNKIIFKSQKSITKLLLNNQEGFLWKTAVNIKMNDDLLN